MKIEKFWVVCTPLGSLSGRPTRGDILFQTHVQGLAQQFKGGLVPEHIVAIYLDQAEAETVADALLALRAVWDRASHSVVEEIARACANGERPADPMEINDVIGAEIADALQETRTPGEARKDHA